VKDIQLVINYDMPQNIESYIHRIGRTARAGKTGTSCTFFTPENTPLAGELVDVMIESGQVPPAELKSLTSRRDKFPPKKPKHSAFDEPLDYRKVGLPTEMVDWTEEDFEEKLGRDLPGTNEPEEPRIKTTRYGGKLIRRVVRDEDFLTQDDEEIKPTTSRRKKRGFDVTY